MTNFEKFKDEIKRIVDDMAFDDDCVAVVNGKPVACDETINCDGDCDFSEKDGGCLLLFTKWLCEEYGKPKINLPKDIKVDTPILVSNDGEHWLRRYFAEFSTGCVGAWYDGATSWSINNQNDVTYWHYAKLPEE